jgi:hypothetical protein
MHKSRVQRCEPVDAHCDSSRDSDEDFTCNLSFRIAVELNSYAFRNRSTGVSHAFIPTSSVVSDFVALFSWAH